MTYRERYETAPRQTWAPPKGASTRKSRRYSSMDIVPGIQTPWTNRLTTDQVGAMLIAKPSVVDVGGDLILKVTMINNSYPTGWRAWLHIAVNNLEIPTEVLPESLKLFIAGAPGTPTIKEIPWKAGTASMLFTIWFVNDNWPISEQISNKFSFPIGVKPPKEPLPPAQQTTLTTECPSNTAGGSIVATIKNNGLKATMGYIHAYYDGAPKDGWRQIGIPSVGETIKTTIPLPAGWPGGNVKTWIQAIPEGYVLEELVSNECNCYIAAAQEPPVEPPIEPPVEPPENGNGDVCLDGTYWCEATGTCIPYDQVCEEPEEPGEPTDPTLIAGAAAAAAAIIGGALYLRYRRK